MRLILERKIPRSLDVFYIFLIKLLTKCIGVYHPVYIKGSLISKGERSCEDRWNRMQAIMKRLNVKTVLDLGCAEGYFVQKSSLELNCMSIGIDADIRRLNIAANTAIINETTRCGFIFMEISKENLELVEKADSIIFLSVLHHMMYEKEYNYALSLLKCIKSKTKKVLFFDMGQSNEENQPWAGLLPNMGEDPSVWIKKLLLDAGFSKVEDLGMTDSYRSTSKRNYFAAYV